MSLLVLSFVAGVLTVLAPCVLPILPVIIGGSVINGHKSRPRVIIVSFATSVLLFTLLIKFLVEQFGLFPDDLKKIAARILILFGIFLLLPRLWTWVMTKTGLEHATNTAQSQTGTGLKGDILLGFVLGPVFNTCSPTYAVLVATILPVSFYRGLLNIIVYIVGLVLVLSLIGFGGRKIVTKLKRAANPHGLFKKIIALILVLLGVAMLQGWDKDIEAYLLQNNLAIDTTLREGKAVRGALN